MQTDKIEIIANLYFMLVVNSRHNIGKSVALYGEAGELDLATAEKEMDVLRQKISSIDY